MLKLPDGTVVTPGNPFTYLEIQYPANWIQLATPEEKTALGLAESVDTPRPDDTYATVEEDGHGGWIVTPFTTEYLQTMLLARATAARWNREIGGIVVGGISVATDDRSKLMIVGARLAANSDPAWTTRWAVGDVSVTLDVAAMTAISDAVQAHVSACFTAFSLVVEAIKAGTITTYEEVDSAMLAP